MSEATQAPEAIAARFKNAARAALGLAALMWLIKVAESALSLDLGAWTIHPRDPTYLKGILSAPILHGSWSHLIANTPPVIVLTTTLLFGYPRSARAVLPLLYLATGLLVWLFARPVYHLGASGLTFGMMFFIFVSGVLRWDPRAIALAMIVFFLYGGMIWGVFPGRAGISYETHFFAALLGIMLAIVLRNVDPPPPRKRYSWEEEDDHVDDNDVR